MPRVSLDVKRRRVAAGFRALAAGVFVLLVFGATVRVHGAGLSCPDWPLCFGEVVPELDFHVFLEWGHRVLASVVSVVFLGLAVVVGWDPALRALAGRWVLGAGLVLAAQIVLGGLTVLQLLADWSVTLHLLTGNLFLWCINSLAIVVADRRGFGQVTPALRTATLVLLGAWFLQMGLGGYVSSNHAGTACSEWPSCNGGVWFPTFSGIVGLQVFHRLGAYVVTVLAAAFLALAWSDPALRRYAIGVTGLVAVQIGLGVTNVLLGLPVETAVAHSAVGDLLGVVLTFAAWNVVRRPVFRPGAAARVGALGRA